MSAQDSLYPQATRELAEERKRLAPGPAQAFLFPRSQRLDFHSLHHLFRAAAGTGRLLRFAVRDQITLIGKLTYASTLSN